MDNTINRRRNYFIKKQFQSEFILKFITLIMLGSAISVSILYLLSSRTITTSFENSRLTVKSTADFMLPAIAVSALVSTILISIATAAVTLFTSHRIAGPMYKLEQLLKSVAAGELYREAHFRQNDELKAITAAFNDMTKAVKSGVMGLKEEAAALGNLINELEKISRAGGVTDELKKITTDMSALKNKINDKLSFFKIN